MSDLRKIMIAIDDMDDSAAFNYLKNWPITTLPTVKIGMEMYFKYGPSLIKHLYENFQIDIFLDLKLHDIPNTVSKAIKALKDLPISFLTLHLSGGEKMIQAGIAQAKDSLPKAKILGVSFLTSLNKKDLFDLFGITDLKIAFERLYLLALNTHVDGVVLSAMELEWATQIEKKYPYKILKVTPGIRFADEISLGNVSDQARVETPESALRKGADFLVIGRSLTKSSDLDRRVRELRILLNKEII